MRKDTTVVLTEMAERLNYELGIDPPIRQSTPYDWWKRTKNDDIPVPMPSPIRWVGRSPVFLMRDIKRWYQVYKGEEINT